MPTKNNNPVHRTKRSSCSEVVERNPSSGVWSIILSLLGCLVVAMLWSVYNGHTKTGEIDRSISGTTTPAKASASKLHELIKQGATADLQRHMDLLGESELNADINGMTPVMFASSVGNVSIVELLLKRGADPDKRGSSERTALQYAAEKNHIAVARTLLEFGADIDAYDSSRLTPLIMAADRGYTELGILFIESGADVNIQHVQGWTALIDAARNGNVSLVRRLLLAGADRDLSTSNGWRAIDFARNNKHKKVVKMLAE